MTRDKLLETHFFPLSTMEFVTIANKLGLIPGPEYEMVKRRFLKSTILDVHTAELNPVSLDLQFSSYYFLKRVIIKAAEFDRIVRNIHPHRSTLRNYACVHLAFRYCKDVLDPKKIPSNLLPYIDMHKISVLLGVSVTFYLKELDKLAKIVKLEHHLKPDVEKVGIYLFRMYNNSIWSTPKMLMRYVRSIVQDYIKQWKSNLNVFGNSTQDPLTEQYNLVYATSFYLAFLSKGSSSPAFRSHLQKIFLLPSPTSIQRYAELMLRVVPQYNAPAEWSNGSKSSKTLKSPQMQPQNQKLPKEFNNLSPSARKLKILISNHLGSIDQLLEERKNLLITTQDTDYNQISKSLSHTIFLNIDLEKENDILEKENDRVYSAETFFNHLKKSLSDRHIAKSARIKRERED